MNQLDWVWVSMKASLWIGLDWIGLDWVNKLLFWIGLGQEKVTHVQLCSRMRRLMVPSQGFFQKG